MTNAGIARAFQHMAVMLELEGANPFRVRAYREAARVVETLIEPLAVIGSRDKGLEGIPGIGKDLAQKIRDLIATGGFKGYDELRAKYPDEIVALTDLQGLGAKRVKVLVDQLGIRDRAGLEAAARAGRLRDLPGFGLKTEQKILTSIANVSQWSGRVLLTQAWALAESLTAELRALPGVTQVEAAGSLRRRRDTVGDLDIVACGGDCDALMDRFTGLGQIVEVIGRGSTKCSVRVDMGLQVDLRHVPEDSFGAALVYFTGSKAHNIELRRVALDQGCSLNEYALTRGDAVVASRTEHDVYRALGLDWVPPELREGLGEVALAREHRLPKLIALDDLRGDLHMHTTRSDGKASIVEMVRACRERGYAYCAITEHSKSLTFAGGFDEARVRQSVDEIAAARREVPGIRVLHGLEVDILPDGALDLDDDGLKLLDWVTLSLHRTLDQPAPEVTARVLRALEHPAACALSHPTARRIGQRAGVPIDLDAVCMKAAERGVAVEINGQPERTDLCDTQARRAAELGCTLVIDSDAHAVVDLDFVRWGVFAARRAGLTADQVLNTRSPEDLQAFLDRRGRRPAGARAKTAAGSGAAKPGAVPATAATPKAKASPAPRRPSPRSGPVPRATAAPPAPTRAPKRSGAAPRPRAPQPRKRG